MVQRGLDAIARKSPTPDNIAFAAKIKTRQALGRDYDFYTTSDMRFDVGDGNPNFLKDKSPRP